MIIPNNESADPVKPKALYSLGILVVAIFAMALPALIETTTVVEKARMAIKLSALGAAALLIFQQGPKAIPHQQALLGGALAVAVTLSGLTACGLPHGPFLSLLFAPLALAVLTGEFRESGYLLRLSLLGLLAAFPVAWLEDAMESSLGYSVFIANVSGYLLYYFGNDVKLAGDILATPGGSVRIVGECSGLKMMLLLASLVFCYGLSFRLGLINWLKLAGWALLCGLLVSILRVDLMVFFLENENAFHFMHEGAGSELFTIAALLGTSILGRKQVEPPLLRFFQTKWNTNALTRYQLTALCLAAVLGLAAGLYTLQ